MLKTYPSCGFIVLYLPFGKLYFNTSKSKIHYVSELRESFILTFIREQQIIRGKYAPVEHE